MARRARFLGHLPIVPRCAMIAMIGFGLVGAVVGLIVGLFAYPPTVAFAMVEVGFPAALLGGILGVLAGLVITAVPRARSSSTPKRV